MTTMDKVIAVWDWEREPLPEARVVVCRPGYLLGKATPRADACNAHFDALRTGTVFVHSEDDWKKAHHPPRGIIPAIYAEWQSELARLPDLLAAKAERHALVLCPREELDLGDATDWWAVGEEAKRIDLVVIIPPPEARTCAICNGTGSRRPSHNESGCDEGGEHYCFVRACGNCGGKGTDNSWPMHPAWIRGIVEQCRAAGVPVCFLGWGSFATTISYGSIREYRSYAVCRCGVVDNVTMVAWSAHKRACDLPVQVMYHVGSEHSGRLLDGAEVMDLPEWILSADPR